MRQTARLDPAASDAFWRFSLALYARPGVAGALIGLQDRAGCDVNLLLLALWLGTRGREIDERQLAAAAADAKPLAAIAAGLRSLRRGLRTAADADARGLHRRVLGLELVAERQVQRRLAAHLARDPRPGAFDGLSMALANLACCLAAEAGSPEAGVLHEALAALMRRS